MGIRSQRAVRLRRCLQEARLQVILTLVGTLPFLLAGCVTAPPTVPLEQKLVDKNEERYFELTDRVAKQESQIARLESQLEAIKVSKVKKAKPTKEEVDENEDAEQGDSPDLDESTLSPLEDEPVDTVVDSRHEGMHLYFEGMKDLEAGKSDTALKAFREFLAATPDHVYADRAQYHIAEAHLFAKEYSLALVALNLFLSRYPHSFQVPEALYRQALSYENLGKRDAASSALQDLLKRYPQAPVAKQAEQRLARLTTGSAAPPLLSQ